MKRESSAEFYARNAAKGRTVRFSINLNLNHLTPEQRKEVNTGIGSMSIKGGTLTPAQCKRILGVINEDD